MSLAIIGAGIAGLTAASTISAPDQITIYEKSRGLGGRAATRWHDLPDGRRVYVDHGAQYLRDESAAMHAILQAESPAAGSPDSPLADIGRPVWTFDAANRISEGDRAQNTAPKWSYKNGMSQLGRSLVTTHALHVTLETRVAYFKYAKAQFWLYDQNDQAIGLPTDQLLITIPAGQAADLIAASDLPSGEKTTLETELRKAIYRRCLSITLGYDRPVTAVPYYALINSDRAHALAWLAFEHAKPGHVPPGQSVIIAQMAATYSRDQWDTPDVTAEVAQMVSTLLGEDLTQPDWNNTQRWRYSQPDTTISDAGLNGVFDGLWFAGDYTRGGRVHLAAQSGADVAAQIQASAR